MYTHGHCFAHTNTHMLTHTCSHTHAHTHAHTHPHTHTPTPPPHPPPTHTPLTETAVCESDCSPVVGVGCYGEVLLLIFQSLLKVACRLIRQANVAIGTTYNSKVMTSITGCQIPALIFSFNTTFLRLQQFSACRSVFHYFIKLKTTFAI